MTKNYGWLPDLPDQRDRKYTLKASASAVAASLPAAADVVAASPGPYDQLQLGSCTANALAGAVEHDLKAQGLTDAVPSRLFIYYNERVIEHTVASDSGAMLRDGMKTLNKQGVCPETIWPYDPDKFADKPPKANYKTALGVRAVRYRKILRGKTTANALLAHKQVIAVDQRPFVFGFTVYESFESDAVAASGEVPMPAKKEKVVGGHAVRAIGYDDNHPVEGAAPGAFRIRNSWGADWGIQGDFWLPYGYITSASLSSDFWTLTTVGTPVPAAS